MSSYVEAAIEAALTRYLLNTEYGQYNRNLEETRKYLAREVSDIINQHVADSFVGTHITLVDKTTETDIAMRKVNFSLEPLTQTGYDWLCSIMAKRA